MKLTITTKYKNMSNKDQFGGKLPAGVTPKKYQAMKATKRKITTDNAGTTEENRKSGDKNFNN